MKKIRIVFDEWVWEFAFSSSLLFHSLHAAKLNICFLVAAIYLHLYTYSGPPVGKGGGVSDTLPGARKVYLMRS